MANPNEGRRYDAEYLALRDEVVTLILPELEELLKVGRRIEQKVGSAEGWRKTTAVQMAVQSTLGSFSNLCCCVFGWAERLPGVEKPPYSVVHGGSWSHSLFSEENFDSVLSSLLHEVLRHMQTEPYEALEVVQREREKKGL